MTTNQPQTNRDSIWRALLVAGLLMGSTLAISLLSPGYLSPEFARRLTGVLMGAVVIYYANAVPKALVPLMKMRGDPVAEQALRRFAGWSLTLGGVGYAVAWAIAPIAHASTLSITLLATALLLAIARWVRASAGSTRV